MLGEQGFEVILIQSKGSLFLLSDTGKIINPLALLYPYTDYTNYTDYTAYTRYTANPEKSTGNRFPA